MSSQQVLSALGHAVSGSVGTAISTASLYPLDLVTTRLKAQRKSGDSLGDYAGVISALKGIPANEGGLKALYSGLGLDGLEAHRLVVGKRRGVGDVGDSGVHE